MPNCLVCGKPAARKHARFCSRVCHGVWKTGRATDGTMLPHAATERACEHCGNAFTPVPAQVKNGQGRFCSSACAGLARRKIDDFQYTTRMAWYLSRGWAKLSEELREAAGGCQLCGVGDTRLAVHHKIDPYPMRDVTLLLDRGNLVVTCDDCHRKTHEPGAVSICQMCGRKFHHAPSRAGKARFCSQACYRA